MDMKKNALIIGGGFAGLEAAILLNKAGLDVTLVSDRPYLFIYPTSIWVATGERSIERVKLDLHDVSRRHGFAFVHGAVQTIRGADKVVRVNDQEYGADVLMVAIGGKPLSMPGIEHTHGISGPPEGVVGLHQALQELIAKGQGRIAMGFGGNPKDPSAARGGPVFELMFNVDHLLRKRGIRDQFELTFFAPMPSPGERMGVKAVEAIQKTFDRLGIKKRFGTKIAGFDPSSAVRFEDGTLLESDVTVFVPGHSGHPVLASSDLPLNAAGFVKIDEGCAVPGFPGVYAIGDAAELSGPDWRAKQGHMAEIMARVASENAVAELEERAERTSYIPHVSIICLMDMGNGAAYVRRDTTGEKMVPLPVVGHWMKKGWGAYYKMSKKKQCPRLPGM